MVREWSRRHIYNPGDRFYNFVIVSYAPTGKTECGRTYTRWNCLCDCGNEFVTTTKQIRKGVQKSCGCKSQLHRFRMMTAREVIGTCKFHHYVNAAKRRDISWSLNKDDFINMIFSNCHYCNQEPYLLVKRVNHQMKVNGVDRIDSKLGYQLDNCVPCCKFCNGAKGASTEDEYLKWIARLKCQG